MFLLCLFLLLLDPLKLLSHLSLAFLLHHADLPLHKFIMGLLCSSLVFLEHHIDLFALHSFLNVISLSLARLDLDVCDRTVPRNNSLTGPSLHPLLFHAFEVLVDGSSCCIGVLCHDSLDLSGHFCFKLLSTYRHFSINLF